MKDVEKVKEIRRALAEVFKRFGLRYVDASVLAELFIVDRSVSVGELSSRIGQSISGITSALHRLMKMHLVVRDKDGKMYIYRTESNLLSALLHLIDDVRRHELRVLLNKLHSVGNDSDENLMHLLEKVENADRYLTMLVSILNEHGGEMDENSTNCR